MVVPLTLHRGLVRLLAVTAVGMPGARRPESHQVGKAADLQHHRRRRAPRIAPHVHAFVVRPALHAGWRWWLERGDGDQLAAAARPSSTPQLARADTLRVRLAAASSPVETYEDAHGQIRWRLLSRAGGLLAVSAVGYATRVAAERAIAAFRHEASHAELVDD